MRRRIGYLPELFRYQPWLRAREVVELHGRLRSAVGGGGSGIQLSPIMGALAAEWIAYDEPQSLSDGRLVAPDRRALVVAS